MSDTIEIIQADSSVTVGVGVGVGPQGPPGTTDFNQLQNVPSTFPPSAHTHTASAITDFNAAAASASPVQSVAGRTGSVTLAVADVANAVADTDSRLSDSRNPLAHSHTLADITDAGTAAAAATTDFATSAQGLLADSAVQPGDLAAVATTGSYADLANVPSTFTPSSHTHSISDVTSLQTTLDGKAATLHSHAISDVTNLQTALDGKAASSHTHTANQVTDFNVAAAAAAPVQSVAGRTGAVTLAVADVSGAVSGTDARLSDARTPLAHTHTPSEVGLGNVANAAQVTAVTGTAPIVSSGGTTPAISISAATTGAAGSMSAADKLKLDGIASGAEVNVNADWNASSGDAQILNKPSIPLATSQTPIALGGTSALIGTSTEYARADHKHAIEIASINASNLRAHLNVADGAEVNVNADWNATSGDAEILNKPSTFAPSAHTHAISDVTNLQNTLDGKVDKITGKGLSTEDFTSAEKTKLAGIATGAEVNVNADWTASSGDAQILNKPSTFAPSAHVSSHHTGGTDALTPANIGAVPTSRTISSGTGLTGGGDLTANRTLAVSYGTTAGTAAEGNDARITGAAPKVGTTDIEITDSTKGVILKSPNNTRYRLTVSNSGLPIFTALLLFLLVSLAPAQNVGMATDIYGTILTDRFNALTFTNPVAWIHTAPTAIGTTHGTLLWFGLPAQLSVQGADGRHAIIANAPAGGGAAVIGTSSSGGAAGKFYQDTTYTSPALWVSRQTSSTNSATLGVGSSSTGSTNAKAVSVSHGTNEVFFVRHDGAVSSLYQRFGSGSPQGVVTAPVGAVYHRTDGGTGTSFYVKESGTGNTGWVAK